MSRSARRSGSASVTTVEQPPEILVELQGVTKIYANGTVALRGIDLALQPGRIHGIVGANGAGKSTLIKILAGAESPTRGALRWCGAEVEWWRSPAAARRFGVATIHQHIPLVPTLSVLENVFLDRGGMAFRSRRRTADFEALLTRVGYWVDADALVGDLAIGARQMVGILQALAVGARCVVMDEPTASLARHERQLVFRAIRTLAREHNTAFLFVSHFLDEVLHLTDTVSVIRDGRVSAEAPTADWNEHSLVRALLGNRLAATPASPGTNMDEQAAPVALRIDRLTAPGVRDVSATVRAGEVVGLAGLLGSGRSELLHAVYGAAPRRGGSVSVLDRPIRPSPRRALEAGMALVPEDRARQGLHRDWEIWRNISLGDLSRLSHGGLVTNRRVERQRAMEVMAKFKIVAHSVDAPVSSLSGGNAQKVLFAKWAYAGAKVLLLDEPTAGVDVGARGDILDMIRHAARSGTAVVVVCSEFEELLRIADRVIVIRKGRVVSERRSKSTTEDELLALAGGLA